MHKIIKLIGATIIFAFITTQPLCRAAAQVQAEEASVEEASVEETSVEEESLFSRRQPSQIEDAIKEIAEGSSCAGETWSNRGEAPLGYIKGMALSFARSLCNLKLRNDDSGAIKIMSEADRGDADSDVFSWYRRIFSMFKMSTREAGEASLRSLYTLGMGLGMRESSGKYCTGWDRSAGRHRKSSQAEAGLFQISYDSISAADELGRLYRQFRSQTSQCDLSTFKQEVSCGDSSTLGTGEGAAFQKFVKACPAFATEYAMTLLRLVRTHFGPINRREAQVKPACHYMFQQIQDYVNSDPARVCQAFSFN